MDNLTHSLTGLALARTGLDRICPRAVWLLLVSANAPDADIIAAIRGSFRYLEVHRGYTHSLLGAPLMAALSVVLVAALSGRQLPWFRAWLLCLLGVFSHLLLDLTNSYGVRLLLPFSSRWSFLDINSLYDAYILAILAFAAVWPAFVRLVNREIGATRESPGSVVAICALCLVLAFDVARADLHGRAVAQLESRLYNDAPPVSVAALPDPFNPLRWTAVVETQQDFRMWQVTPLSGSLFTSQALFYKPPITAALATASEQDPFRYFLYFARFPVWSEQPVFRDNTRGARLDLTDLRFGSPGAGAFHCIGYFNGQEKLAGKWFTYGTGNDFGWNGARAGLESTPAR